MDTQLSQLPLLRRHIRLTWGKLRRGNRRLLQAARDPKFHQSRTSWPVYVSRHEQLSLVAAALERQMDPEDFARVELRRLPPEGAELLDHGLLYVPNDYIVPGGRFNELYGWDSYWIVLGLLHDGEFELARDMVDNFLYQVRHYGAILNANRTYYLTRSHPPLLTGMALAIYRAFGDAAWLAGALPVIEQYYRFWTEGQRRTEETGLSRYFDDGSGPAAEVLADERDALGNTHYDRVQAFFRANPDFPYGYELERFYDAANDRLTPLFYVADRAMRESGFDPSDRFGRFNLAVVDVNPVCLNALLCIMERETAEIHAILGRPEAAEEWRARAERRGAQVNRLMWDEESGLYLDYDVRQGARRRYPFATTFYPLWAGIASPEQARRVIGNLGMFEAPGGLLTSTNESGSHWDAPYGWAPLQQIAVAGMRRYGAEEDADRIARKWLLLVLQEFIEHNAIFEKYNVVERTSRTDQTFGYGYNVVGFGWTNGTVLDMLADLPRRALQERGR